jgi:hypothetical protein
MEEKLPRVFITLCWTVSRSVNQTFLKPPAFFTIWGRSNEDWTSEQKSEHRSLKINQYSQHDKGTGHRIGRGADSIIDQTEIIQVTSEE